MLICYDGRAVPVLVQVFENAIEFIFYPRGLDDFLIGSDTLFVEKVCGGLDGNRLGLNRCGRFCLLHFLICITLDIKAFPWFT